MTIRKFWLLLFCLFLNPVRSAMAAPDPATEYLQARAALRQPPLQASLLEARSRIPSAYRGRIFEVSAVVGGLVTADGDSMALLNAAEFPSTPICRSPCATRPGSNSQQTIRALIQVAPTAMSSRFRTCASCPPRLSSPWPPGSNDRRPAPPSSPVPFAVLRAAAHPLRDTRHPCLPAPARSRRCPTAPKTSMRLTAPPSAI